MKLLLLLALWGGGQYLLVSPPTSLTVSAYKHLEWSQVAQSNIDAMTFVYKLYVNNRFAAVVQNVNCEHNPTPIFRCVALVPDSIAPGTYRAALTAMKAINGAKESDLSSPTSLFVMNYAPLKPKPEVTVADDIVTVNPNPTCEWVQSVTAPLDIKNHSWKYHLDGAGLGMPFQDVKCDNGPTDYKCNAKLNVTTPGQHSVYIITTNTEGGQSANSDPSPTTTFYVSGTGLESPNTVVIKKKEDK